MSLTKTSLFNVTKTQYQYKLKAYIGFFGALAAVQAIAVLLSLGGMGGAGTGTEMIQFSIKLFSNEIIVLLTFFWAVVVSVALTTKGYRDGDAVFVSNRLSSNLANGAFLLTCCLAGGLTAVLSGVVLRLVLFFSTGGAGIVSQNFFMTPAELAVGTAVTALYLLLLGTAGYLCGMLVQYSKVFVVILPSLFFGLLILVGRDAGIREMLLPPINFVVQESSLILLALKIILIAAVMFGIALLLSNRAEVRK
ncbi:MAG: hypothetical protein KGZ75_07080 [Syntrophomonadaceae bacterium]|nr:hypothetical protein [Syntrophomonadaceae bacterium]